MFSLHNSLLTLSLLAPLALSACSNIDSAKATTGATVAGTVATATLSAPDLATLQTACNDFNLAASAASTATGGGAKATVGKVAAPGQAFCSIVAGGAAPPNADANSTNWLAVLGTTLSTIKALAPLAIAAF